MIAKPEEPVEPEKLPAPETVRARWQLTQSPIGRTGRLRSWATVAVGVIALAVCAYLYGLTI
jgi:hypothetical protein